MPAVAEHKRRSARPVEDLAREERVLASVTQAVVAEAERSGRPVPDIGAVRSFFAAQIEAAKSIQRQQLTQPAASGPVPDLQRELRPALNRIGERISRLIVALPPCHGGDGCDPEVIFAATVDALRARELAPEPLAAIARALTWLTERAALPTRAKDASAARPLN